MKRLTCFQELGEIVQPAEDAIVIISNGLSISGEMVGVGGTKPTRNFIQRALLESGLADIEIFSMDLKFSNKVCYMYIHRVLPEKCIFSIS